MGCGYGMTRSRWPAITAAPCCCFGYEAADGAAGAVGAYGPAAAVLRGAAAGIRDRTGRAVPKNSVGAKPVYPFGRNSTRHYIRLYPAPAGQQRAADAAGGGSHSLGAHG